MLYDSLRRFSRGTSRVPFKNWHAGYRHENTSRTPHSTENSPHEPGSSTAGSSQRPKCYFGLQGQCAIPDQSWPWPPKTYNPFSPNAKTSHKNVGPVNYQGEEVPPPDPLRFYPGTNVQAPAWIHHPRPGIPSIANIPRAPDPYPEISNVIYASSGFSDATTEPKKETHLISFVDGSYKIVNKKDKYDGYNPTHEVHECESSTCTTCGSIKIGAIKAADAVSTAVYRSQTHEPSAIQVESVDPQAETLNIPQRGKGEAADKPPQTASFIRERSDPEVSSLGTVNKTTDDSPPNATLQDAVSTKEKVINTLLGIFTLNPQQSGAIRKQTSNRDHASKNHKATEQELPKLNKLTQKDEAIKTGEVEKIADNKSTGILQYGMQLSDQWVAEHPLLEISQEISKPISSSVQGEKSDIEAMQQTTVEDYKFMVANMPETYVVQELIHEIQNIQKNTIQDYKYMIDNPFCDPTAVKDKMVSAPGMTDMTGVDLIAEISTINEKVVQNNQAVTSERIQGTPAMKAELRSDIAASKNETIGKTGDHTKETAKAKTDLLKEISTVKDASPQNIASMTERPAKEIATVKEHVIHNTNTTETTRQHEMLVKNTPGYTDFSGLTNNPANEIVDLSEQLVNDASDMEQRALAIKTRVNEDVLRIKELVKEMAAVQKKTSITVEKPLKEIAAMKKDFMKELSAIKNNTMGNAEIFEKPVQEFTKMNCELMREMAIVKDKTIQNTKLSKETVKEIALMKEELRKEKEPLKSTTTVSNYAMATEKPANDIAKMKEELLPEMAAMIVNRLENVTLASEKPVQRIEQMKHELLQTMTSIKDKMTENCAKAAEKHLGEMGKMKAELMKGIEEVKQRSADMAEKPAKEIATMKEEVLKEIENSIRNYRIPTKIPVMQIPAIDGGVAGKREEKKAVQKLETATGADITEAKPPTLPIDKIAENAVFSEGSVTELAPMAKLLIKELESFKERTIQNALMANLRMKEIAEIKEELCRERAAFTDKIRNSETTETPIPERITLQTLQQLANDSEISDGHQHRSGEHPGSIDSGENCSLRGQCDNPYNRLQPQGYSTNKIGGDASSPKSGFPEAPSPPLPSTKKRNQPTVCFEQTGCSENKAGQHVIIETEMSHGKQNTHLAQPTEQVRSSSSKTRSPYPTDTSTTNAAKLSQPCSPSTDHLSTYPPTDRVPGDQPCILMNPPQCEDVSTRPLQLPFATNPPEMCKRDSMGSRLASIPGPIKDVSENPQDSSCCHPPAVQCSSAAPLCGQAPDDDLSRILTKGVIPIEQSKISDFFFHVTDASSPADTYSAAKDCSCPTSKPRGFSNKKRKPPSSPGGKPGPTSGNPTGKCPSGSTVSKPQAKSGNQCVSGSPQSCTSSGTHGPAPRSGNIKNSSSSRKQRSPANQELFILNSNASEQTYVEPGNSAFSHRPRKPANSRQILTSQPARPGTLCTSHTPVYTSNNDASSILDNTEKRPESLSDRTPSRPTNLGNSSPVCRSRNTGGRLTPGTDSSGKSGGTKASVRTMETTEDAIAVNKTHTTGNRAKPAQWDEKGIAKVRRSFLTAWPSTQIIPHNVKSETSEDRDICLSQNVPALPFNRPSDAVTQKTEDTDTLFRALNTQSTKPTKEDPPKTTPPPESTGQSEMNLLDLAGSVTKPSNVLAKTVSGTAFPIDDKLKEVRFNKLKHHEDNSTENPSASAPNNLPAVGSRTPYLSPSQQESFEKESNKPSDPPGIPVATILLLSRAAESLNIKISKPKYKGSTNRKRAGFIPTQNSIEYANASDSFRETPESDNIGSPINTIDITYHEASMPSNRETLTKGSQFNRYSSKNPEQRHDYSLTKLASLPVEIRGHEDAKTTQASIIRNKYSSLNDKRSYRGDGAKFLRERKFGEPKELSAVCFFTQNQDTANNNVEANQYYGSNRRKEFPSKVRSAASVPIERQTSSGSVVCTEPSVLTKQQVSERNEKITKLERALSAASEKHPKLQYIINKLRTEVVGGSWREQLKSLVLFSTEDLDRAIAEILSTEKTLQSCPDGNQTKKNSSRTSSFREDFDRAVAECLSAERASNAMPETHGTVQNHKDESAFSRVECAIAKSLSTEKTTKHKQLKERSHSLRKEQLSSISITGISNGNIDKTSTSLTPGASVPTESNLRMDSVENTVHKLSENSEVIFRKEQEPEIIKRSQTEEYRPRQNFNNKPSAEQIITESSSNKTQKGKRLLTLVATPIQIPPSESEEKPSESQSTANSPEANKSNPHHDFKGPRTVITKPPRNLLHTAVSTRRNLLKELSKSDIPTSESNCSSQYLKSIPDQNPQTKKNELKAQSGPPGCPCSKNTGSSSRENYSGRSDGGNTSGGGSSHSFPDDGSLPKKVNEGLNKQVATEMGAFLGYFKMMAHFGRVDVAYRGLESFFRKQVNEEREHALEIASWTNLRGGKNQMKTVGGDDATPHQSLSSYAKALAQAVAMETVVTKSLHKLRETSECHGDVMTSKYLSKLHLREQAESINEISRLVTNAQRTQSSAREMLTFDETLYAKYKDD